MVNSPDSSSSSDSYASPIVSFNLIQHSQTQPSDETIASSCSTNRLGTLLLKSRTNPKNEEIVQTVETPGLISSAPRGSLNHLTRDNFKRIKPCNTGVHISLEHFLDFQPPRFSLAPFELAHFLSLSPSQTSSSNTPRSTNVDVGATTDKEKQERVLISMSLRDPSSASSSCDNDDYNDESMSTDKTKSVPVNGDDHAVALGGRGVVKVSARDYLDWALPRPPDLLFSIADEPTPTSSVAVSKKRLEKSLKRSLNWLNEIAPLVKTQTNLFATLVGSQDRSRRIEFSKSLLGISSSRATSLVTTLSSPLDSLISGYVLSIPSKCSIEQSNDLLKSSLSPLPTSKPRIVLAPKGPHEILRLIRDVGIDLFAAEEWSQNCSTWGIALDFEFPVSATTTTLTTTTSPEKKEKKKSIGINLYQTCHAFDFSPLSTSTLALSTSVQDPHPFGPCGPPTKSYVHHLLLAHEMTSHVILALHNQTLMNQFFESIRKVLKSGSGGAKRFEEEVEKFENLYEDREKGSEEYEIVKQGRKGWRMVEKARGKGSLKDKVLELEKQQQKDQEEVNKVVIDVEEEKGKVLVGQELK
ncbi:hypothetical protein JCM5350_006224 [Sporobolomyces pararoseus]